MGGTDWSVPAALSSTGSHPPGPLLVTKAGDGHLYASPGVERAELQMTTVEVGHE
jgi:hypothetical protein